MSPPNGPAGPEPEAAAGSAAYELLDAEAAAGSPLHERLVLVSGNAELARDLAVAVARCLGCRAVVGSNIFDEGIAQIVGAWHMSALAAIDEGHGLSALVEYAPLLRLVRALTDSLLLSGDDGGRLVVGSESVAGAFAAAALYPDATWLDISDGHAWPRAPDVELTSSWPPPPQSLDVLAGCLGVEVDRLRHAIGAACG
jgi:hypothetical protein